VEHKNQKKSNEMNYPRFTKVIIYYFMTRKPSISRRNRIHWHYIRDDALFSTIKVVSRHQTTQQYGAILHIELTTAEIRNNVGSHEEGKESEESDDDRDKGSDDDSEETVKAGAGKDDDDDDDEDDDDNAQH
nr:hypothetical protein [Tanacetum cinerariifolium]